jgi:hypothetical protein
LRDERSLARRFGRILFGTDRKTLRTLGISRWHKRCPGFAGFRIILRGLPGHGRNADEVITTRTLNFPAGKLFIALQVLLAFGTGKFEFVHGLDLDSPDDEQKPFAMQLWPGKSSHDIWSASSSAK